MCKNLSLLHCCSSWLIKVELIKIISWLFHWSFFLSDPNGKMNSFFARLHFMNIKTLYLLFLICLNSQFPLYISLFHINKLFFTIVMADLENSVSCPLKKNKKTYITFVVDCLTLIKSISNLLPATHYIWLPKQSV